MNRCSQRFHSGPKRPKHTQYVGSMQHERNREIHPNNIWIETGLDKDKTVLWHELVTEDLVSSRLLNWTWSDNYKVVINNVNELVLERQDPTATCQTLVWRRLRYIHHKARAININNP